MTDLPLSALLAALVVLLVLSGFFSMAETAMMAASRYRLKARHEAGYVGASLALDLLAQIDKLLGVILLFNNLVNIAAATLVSVIAIELFGDAEWALGAGTLLLTFVILVFSEITPKVIGATHADALASAVSFVLTPLLRVFYPAVWFVNLFVSTLLAVTRLKARSNQRPQLSVQELRSLVLEAGHFVPQKHRSILLNLFDLEDVTMEDVMTPRGAIEAIDIQDAPEAIVEKLATSYHTRLPVYDGEPSNVIGILHQRRVPSLLLAGNLDRERLREALNQPYFIPGTTPIYTQLQFFQEQHQRVALVVDEYGELEGLVTLEDLIEEIVGKFATSAPGGSLRLAWDSDGSALVDGSSNLREINRKLDLSLPVEGPKTLNGLILEHFRDIPESGVSVKIAGVPMEIVHTQDRMVRTVRIRRPPASE